MPLEKNFWKNLPPGANPLSNRSKVVHISECPFFPSEVEVVTVCEGGWWDTLENVKDGMVHSVRLKNGREWDAYNGWRRKWVLL